MAAERDYPVGPRALYVLGQSAGTRKDVIIFLTYGTPEHQAARRLVRDGLMEKVYVATRPGYVITKAGRTRLMRERVRYQ